MNEEQLKVLAELVLSNNALINGLMGNLNRMEEKVNLLLPASEKNWENVHHFEQLEGLIEMAAAERERLRVYFGLPPEKK